MEAALTTDSIESEQDRRVAETIERERSRLWSFIRSRVADPLDAEDVLQDVFSELLAAYRLVKPIDQAGAWLFQVARNRIVDLFRRKRSSGVQAAGDRDGEETGALEDLLPSPDAGPEAEYARGVLLDALEDALDDLPEEQRDVFLAHEFEGQTFREISAETGVGVNTLLARKRYAVLHLRKALRSIYQSFTGAEAPDETTRKKGTRRRP